MLSETLLHLPTTIYSYLPKLNHKWKGWASHLFNYLFSLVRNYMIIYMEGR